MISYPRPSHPGCAPTLTLQLVQLAIRLAVRRNYRCYQPFSQPNDFPTETQGTQMFQEKSITFSELAFLKKLPKVEAFFLIFWLCGPFLFLIERSPADFWIVLIDIAFLVRCAIKSDYKWTSHWWPKSVFFFWLTMLLSALFRLWHRVSGGLHYDG